VSIIQFVKPICVKKCGRSGSRSAGKMHIILALPGAIFGA
jgi:hypothetical protein